MAYVIRPANVKDASAIGSLEKRCFPAPWSLRLIRSSLLEADDSARVAVVDSTRIVGYIFFRMVADELEIHNIAVSPRHRGRGIGRRMIEDVCGNAMHKGITRAWLEVRAGNAAALHVYSAAGFVRHSFRKRYYSDNGEDAVIMTKELRGR